MKKPTVLVTNDDGVGCFFLHALVAALQEHFSVIVAAPKSEQSWISKGMSRYRSVKVEKYNDLACPAWSVDGTPSDSVNIALGNLLDEKPDIIVSGINVGYNTTLPLILCSGTVAGAVEGAFWGLPALAFSLVVPRDIFDQVKANNGRYNEEFESTLRTAATLSAEFTLKLAGKPENDLIVHNINFPYPLTENTPIKHTFPEIRGLGGFFQDTGNGTYQFSYHHSLDSLPEGNFTDRQCINEGSISYSILNYSKTGN